MGFRSSILAGTRLIREAIQSPNFVAGVAGWSINRDGSAEFNDVTVRGGLHAGTATDYVEVNPLPLPEIDFSTSHPDQVEPASIGFGALGGNTWFVQGPDLGSGADFINFEASSTVNSTTLQYNDLLEIQHESLDVQLSGGSTTFSYHALDGHNFTGDVSYDGVEQGRGLKDYTNVQASTALAAVETIGITSANVTFEVDRAYEIELHYQGSGNTANDGLAFRLRKTNIAGISLWDSLRTHTLPAGGAIMGGDTTQYVVNTTAADITTVIVGTVYRAAGAGNVQWFANASNPTWIRIKDVGPAADYPGARSL